MSHAICTTQCYFAEREFLPGEIIEVGEADTPAHFAPLDSSEVGDRRVYHPAKPKVKPAVAPAHDRVQKGEPVAFSELL